MSLPVLVGVAGPSPLWYLTRGSGLVALLLLTASMALGVLNTARWSPPGWPRFATAGLHRNVSLLVVVVLALHIVTAELDTFAPVGWLAVVVPFASAYRPIWLGLGTVGFDLIVALTVTSLLRGRLGYRAWRVLHWAAYLSWPVAVVHGLGTGTDARLGWVQFITVACVAVVLVAGTWRLVAWPSRPGPRLTAGLAGAIALVAVGAWAVTGPLRPGWAKRAGTPVTLLASSRSAGGSGPTPASGSPAAGSPGSGSASAGSPVAGSPVAGVAGSGSASAGSGSGGSGSASSGSGSGSAAGTAAGARIPALPFSAVLTGTLTQNGPGASGEVTLTVRARLSGGLNGELVIVLRGRAAGGGVALEASDVSFGPLAAPREYRGRVVELNGDQLVAAVTSTAGPALNLGVGLQIDPSSGAVGGNLNAEAASRASGSNDGNANGKH